MKGIKKAGALYRTVAPVLRMLFPIQKIPSESTLPKPAVYLCRHAGDSGPLYILLNLTGVYRPWVYSVFCDEKECFDHSYHYTFLQRNHWPKPLAWLIARLNAFITPKLTRSIRAIPVYRNGAKSMITMRESLKALLEGESLVLFPDTAYRNKDGSVGGIYRGFMLLERMYFAKTGRHLEFVPMGMQPKKKIELGPSLFFADGDCEEQLDEMAAKIQVELNKLA